MGIAGEELSNRVDGRSSMLAGIARIIPSL